MIVLLILVFLGHSPFSLRHVQLRPDLVEMLDIFRLGIYSSMQGFWRHLSRLGFLWVIGPYGKFAVAAYTICMRLRILVMNPGFGIANAVGPVVGQNIGANQLERAETATRIGNIIGTTLMAGIGVLFLLFPHVFVQIFSDDSEVIKIGSVYLKYLSLTFGFIAFSLVIGKALNGAGDTFSPMLITLVSQIGVGLLLVILFSRIIGLTGVWIGISLSNIVQGIAMWFWYRTGRWKTMNITDKNR